MLSIAGIYDGKAIIPTEKIKEKNRYKVIITFVEQIEDKEVEETRLMSSQTNSFGFWEDAKEDLYQDFLPTKK